MKLKYNFVVNQVAENTVAVAVGDDVTKFNGFIKMNDTGAEIFNLLKKDISMEELVSEMIKLYPEDDADKIRASVEDFVGKLKASEVLE